MDRETRSQMHAACPHCPIPLRLICWGPHPASSFMARVACRVPVAFGVKVILIEQLELLVTVAPQVLFEIAKSAALLPVMEMLLVFRLGGPPAVGFAVGAALVVFTGWLPKLRFGGVTTA